MKRLLQIVHFPPLPPCLYGLAKQPCTAFFKSYFSPLYFPLGVVAEPGVFHLATCTHQVVSVSAALDIPHYSLRVNLSTQLIWWCFPPSSRCTGYFYKNKVFEHSSEFPISLLSCVPILFVPVTACSLLSRLLFCTFYLFRMLEFLHSVVCVSKVPHSCNKYFHKEVCLALVCTICKSVAKKSLVGILLCIVLILQSVFATMRFLFLLIRMGSGRMFISIY